MLRLLVGENANYDYDVDIQMEVTNDELKYLHEMVREFSMKWSALCIYLVIGALWYLASIQHVRTNENNEIGRTETMRTNKSHGNGARRNDNYIRNITAPIYDFGTIRATNVQKLISRKKGWKISYEFQVRGHYRHYKSGKVVFINPYEKGKGLETRRTAIRLNPEENQLLERGV